MDKIFSFRSLFILTIILIMFLFLKDDGIIEYRQLLGVRNQLSSEINLKSDKLYELKKESILLEKNPQYIEKIAREKWFFHFPNETIINF